MFNLKKFGIGVDIEDITRFNTFVDPNIAPMIKRVFTDKEINYCYAKENPAPHLAARFSAKEAVIKALSSIGINGLDYSEIEINNDPSGLPFIKLNNPSVQHMDIRVSISHTKENAIAFVVILDTAL